MIDERYQHRLHHSADTGRRALAYQQEIDRLSERQPAHDLVERVAAQEDFVRLDARQRGAPLLVDDALLPATFGWS